MTTSNYRFDDHANTSRLRAVVLERAGLDIQGPGLAKVPWLDRAEIVSDGVVVRSDQLLLAWAVIAAAGTTTEVAAALVEHLIGIFGASAGAVMLVCGEDELEIACVAGHGEGLRLGSRVAFGWNSPAARAARTKEPVFDDDGDVSNDAPALRVAVPLVVSERTLGVISMRFERPRAWGLEARDALLALARVGARALARARRLDEAELAARQGRDLLAVVAHDLRDPLNAMMLRASLVARWAPQAPSGERIRTSAEQIRRCAERMNGLVCDLLDAARLNAGRWALSRRAYSVTQLVEDVIETVAPLALARSIRLESNVTVDGAACCDPARVHQALANLLGNAIKFTHKGGTVVLGAHEDGGRIMLSVTDNGQGIAESDLPYLFDRYWKGGRPSPEGAGLGLHIAKTILDAHDSAIEVQSRLGAGTTISFSLPLV